MNIKDIFSEFPLFYKWSCEKKLNPEDLSILTEFKNSSSFKALIKWIEGHHVSHCEGKQILDLGGEALLMNKAIEPALQKSKQAQSLIQNLKQLRFPQYTQRQKYKMKIIKKLNLAPSLKAVWRQDLDQGVLCIQFQSLSLNNFKQQIQQLEKAYKHLKEGKQKLWPE